jgi:FKBP-type peptidyl-prolyl cis-trans isomerase FklB
MKHMVTSVLMYGLLNGVSVAAAEEQPTESGDALPSNRIVEINTDEEKINYSLGFELGQDLKRQRLEPLPDALLRGIEDAVSGGKPLVNTTQRNAALKQIREARAQQHLERSQQFLAANAEKDGVQTLPSGLQYRELQPGEGNSPTTDSRVVVNYRGSLIDGTEFDSSYQRGKPSTFEMKKVIKGWREALQLMQEGSKWELYIPPELAYGKRGVRDRIPANSALVYEVELIEVR